ncbi:MAG: hypothetical protein AB1432_09990 [Bacteroidota bacterium]
MIDNNILYFTEDKFYQPFAAVSALSKAYKLTGNKDYLIITRAVGNWIINQMKSPFEGFADKN